MLTAQVSLIKIMILYARKPECEIGIIKTGTGVATILNSVKTKY